jgi:hypothetical protein
MFARDYFFEDVDNRDPNVLNKLYVQKRWWKLANKAQRVGRYMADRRDAGSIPANVCFQKKHTHLHTRELRYEDTMYSCIHFVGFV